MPVQGLEARPVNPYPPRLRWLARQVSETPPEFLANLLSRNVTYAAAAEEAGVTPETIRLWCRRLGIKR